MIDQAEILKKESEDLKLVQAMSQKMDRLKSLALHALVCGETVKFSESQTKVIVEISVPRLWDQNVEYSLKSGTKMEAQ